MSGELSYKKMCEHADAAEADLRRAHEIEKEWAEGYEYPAVSTFVARAQAHLQFVKHYYYMWREERES